MLRLYKSVSKNLKPWPYSKPYSHHTFNSFFKFLPTHRNFVATGCRLIIHPVEIQSEKSPKFILKQLSFKGEPHTTDPQWNCPWNFRPDLDASATFKRDKGWRPDATDREPLRIASWINVDACDVTCGNGCERWRQWWRYRSVERRGAVNIDAVTSLVQIRCESERESAGRGQEPPVSRSYFEVGSGVENL